MYGRSSFSLNDINENGIRSTNWILQREPKCSLKSVNFHQSFHVRSSKNNLSSELKTKTDTLLEVMAEIPAADKLVSYLTNYPTKCSFNNQVEGCEKFSMGYSPNSKHD